MPRQKRCACCGRLFTPYVRAWKTQEVCHRKRCRRWSLQRAQDRWLRKNPDYFRGPEHYARTKAWLAKHPGYRRRYWASHPEYAAADNRKRPERKQRQKGRRADIQETLRRREITRIRGLRGADIQETLRLRLDGVLDILAAPARADIQETMAAPTQPPLPYPP